MATLFEQIFSGHATPAQLGALLIALRMKGETAAEIAGAAEVMRRHATRVRVPEGRVVLDTCGTGGDQAQTFNISTAVALVAAGAGVTVAKHGNRSVSSQCGSADVLASCGVDIEAPVEVVERCLEQLGIGFLFAPGLHAGMHHVGPVRREVGVRSLFNLLGPLSNPARAAHQLLGVYDGALVRVLGETLAQLGVERALVVHGEDGLDEISPCGPSRGAWVEHGKVSELTLHPSDAGLPLVAPESLRGGDATKNAGLLRAVLAGEKGAMRTTVVLNAAAALWVAGLCGNLRGGVALAQSSIDSGAAREKLEGLVRITREPR